MTNKLEARTKLDKLIADQISIFSEMCKSTKFAELILQLYWLHYYRCLSAGVFGELPASARIQTALLEEAIKHTISGILKFGDTDPKTTLAGIARSLNLELVQELNKLAVKINTEYEMYSLIELYDVELVGPRKSQLRIELNPYKNDETRKLFEYFQRIEIDNNRRKNTIHAGSDFIDVFVEEFEPYADLFETAFEYPLDKAASFIRYIYTECKSKLSKAESAMPKTPDGLIDGQDYRTAILYFSSIIFQIEELKSQFGEEVEQYISKLRFNPVEFNEDQLRFHYITRRPLIQIGGDIIASPGLIFDSLLMNTHYTLMESPKVKEAYKAKSSSIFLDKIVKISNMFGYKEILRELDLNEGKKQLGDLDLVLFNKDSGECLIIEAKNHSLPLDVYFKDRLAAIKKLEYETASWEKMVKKRIEHLRLNHNNYGLPATFSYFIVTNHPEILSHFSELIVVTLHEFTEILNNREEYPNFGEIFENLYKGALLLSDDDIEVLKADNMWPFTVMA